MAIVSACAYDARGTLVCPGRLDLGRARIGLDLDTGALPTFQAGYTHLYVVSASGVTPHQARERVRDRLRRFYERAETVPGFRMVWTSRAADRNRVNRNTTIAYEILYAVERPAWARSRTDPTRAGHPRERDAAVYV